MAATIPIPKPQETPSSTASDSPTVFHNVWVTFFAYFDIGDQAGTVAENQLKQLANAPASSLLLAYDVSKSILHTRGSGDLKINILDIYMKEMYGRRIAPFARIQRFGQMYQMDSFPIQGVTEAEIGQLIPATETAMCYPVVSVTNLGIACIQLWAQLPGTWVMPNLVPFVDPSRLTASSVDYTITFGSERWNLQRAHISILDVMCFIATQLLCELGSLHVSPEQRRSTSASWQEVLRTAPRANAEPTGLPSLDYIETYALFHLEGKDITDSAALQAVLNTNARALRALITRDINWQVKSLEVVRKKLERCACSTRDSILWYVASQGSVKIYSQALETRREVSMVLGAFEVELLLGMRYFLEKINYSLNAIEFEVTSPRLLARIHRRNVERLDSFFSLASCTKDTTADRLDRLREAFGINQLSNTTAEKVRALSQLVSAHYEERHQQSQTVLTILFGVFGLGQLMASFFFWYFSTPTPVYLWPPPIAQLASSSHFPTLAIMFVGATIIAMGVFGIVLYNLGHQREKTRRKGE
ncbi:MAG: hypothetical protein WAM82_12275 [Thermoanaerobaculia bacterium]